MPYDADRPYLAIGVTGSRSVPTRAQRDEFVSMLTEWNHAYRIAVHHGNCVGADEFAHAVAHLYVESRIYVYPPVDAKFEMAFDPARPPSRKFEPKPYLDRNKDIVRASDVLVAMPDRPEHLRSGTWSTVRFAVKQGVDAYIIMPDGSVDVRVDMAPGT